MATEIIISEKKDKCSSIEVDGYASVEEIVLIISLLDSVR